MKDDGPVFRTYKVNDFSKAVEIVNRQRCQRCESGVKFNNQSTQPDDDKVVTLNGICSECGLRHGIRFTIDVAIREA